VYPLKNLEVIEGLLIELPLRFLHDRKALELWFAPTVV
jgi:hypothetical protein